ncbi:nucleotidyltransferase family protein [Novosphingobium sediminicola]|uniref:Molybdenum cofactor cytidylyltransferase n=1 Tax=Novosphingobium sediminicola TaxID=563162 RepID=A0A7W6G4Y8_9SPHN|nr:nucleotidyltransferase family protein [Novosphingobium sediminicola]MBB3953500.1 molybdenum cofactor cytidylyltransferase [Novosphingobium sediminicola]
MRPEVILLAAGWSRRMEGADKRLLPWRGAPMVRHAAQLYLALGLPVVVVGRARDEALARALDGLDLRLVANSDEGSEQGASARVGLAACLLDGGQRDWDGVIFALADQPLLRPEDIAALIADFAQHRDAVIIPRHDGVRGNPVLMPGDLALGLNAAPADVSPRAWIERHASRIVWHDAEHSRFTSDIDTPQDRDRLRQYES